MLNPGAKSVLVWFYGQPCCPDKVGGEKHMDPSPVTLLSFLKRGTGVTEPHPSSNSSLEKVSPVAVGTARPIAEAPHGLPRRLPTYQTCDSFGRLVIVLPNRGTREEKIWVNYPFRDGNPCRGASRVFGRRFRFRRSTRGYADRSRKGLLPMLSFCRKQKGGRDHEPRTQTFL